MAARAEGARRQDTRWREQMEMRAALARAKVEEELRDLKRNLGKGGGGGGGGGGG